MCSDEGEGVGNECRDELGRAEGKPLLIRCGGVIRKPLIRNDSR
jgi:hypothetical protein